MYKLQVHSGLGDCLRIINAVKIVDRCLAENTRCYINYVIKKHNEYWAIRNRETFIAVAKDVPLFEYLDDEEFNNSQAEEAMTKVYLRPYITDRKILPLPLPACGVTMDKEKINIAVQVEGSTNYKRFSDKQLKALFSAFDTEKVTFHAVDWPKNYLKNKERFQAFPNVVCREFTFNQNYHLITLCDLLVGPDSFAKYAARAAGKKMVIVCSKAPYVKDVQIMLKHAFEGIFEHPLARVLGWKADTELVDNACDFPEEKIIQAVKELL